ncbi:hypothetical protein V8F20_012873, partial [Naviculisporaceae sp. PSN 640]
LNILNLVNICFIRNTFITYYLLIRILKARPFRPTTPSYPYLSISYRVLGHWVVKRNEGIKGKDIGGEGIRGEGIRGKGIRGEGIRGKGFNEFNSSYNAIYGLVALVLISNNGLVITSQSLFNINSEFYYRFKDFKKAFTGNS